mgnify:CR=1 FL=1
MLQEIIKNKILEVDKLKDTQSITVNEVLSMKISNRGFIKALKSKIKNNQVAIIAEIKRCSPSKGYLDKNLNLNTITFDYENAGATCLSVLTDKEFFKGSLDDLKKVKELTNLPILRKDFIIDESQIIESKIAGADCILLIIAVLSEEKFSKLMEVSKKLNLDVLVEVHDEAELEIALKNNCELIGINNRNLKTFEVSIQTSILLGKKIQNKDVIIVSESGIKTRDDINLLKVSIDDSILLIGTADSFVIAIITLIISRSSSSTSNTTESNSARRELDRPISSSDIGNVTCVYSIVFQNSDEKLF